MPPTCYACASVFLRAEYFMELGSIKIEAFRCAHCDELTFEESITTSTPLPLAPPNFRAQTGTGNRNILTNITRPKGLVFPYSTSL